MNRRKLVMALAALFAGTAMPAAFACSPAPTKNLTPTSAEEAKLPLVRPSMAPPTGLGNCPTTIWPFTFDALTDAQITQYLGIGLDPAWQSTKAYVAGDRASYNGKNYKARWWTQGETPGVAAVWEAQADANGNPPAWSASVGYAGGSQVSYSGNIYSAKWWTQNEVPGTAGSAWTLVGPMKSSATARPAVYHMSAAAPVSTSTGLTSTIRWTTDSFMPSTTTPLADNWQLRINGVVAQQGTSIMTIVPECPPPTPTPTPTPVSNCNIGYRQTGTVTVPVRELDQLTFWLCKGTSCRMTPRFTWYQHTR